jgi:FkbM family methyltransferase
MKYKFIDIGCGSFDVSSDYYGNDVVGIYVEPIKEYLDVLPGGKTIIRVNAGISEKNSFSEMTTFPFNEPIRYITKKHITRLQKSNKSLSNKILISGCGTFLSEPSNVNQLGVKRMVKTITLFDLFNEHNVSEIDHLKIDTEGSEIIILSQLLDIMNNGNIKINESIIFEYNGLCCKKTLYSIAEKISVDYGFNISFLKESWNEDLILTKK